MPLAKTAELIVGPGVDLEIVEQKYVLTIKQSKGDCSYGRFN